MADVFFVVALGIVMLICKAMASQTEEEKQEEQARRSREILKELGY